MLLLLVKSKPPWISKYAPVYLIIQIWAQSSSVLAIQSLNLFISSTPLHLGLKTYGFVEVLPWGGGSHTEGKANSMQQSVPRTALGFYFPPQWSNSCIFYKHISYYLWDIWLNGPNFVGFVVEQGGMYSSNKQIWGYNTRFGILRTSTIHFFKKNARLLSLVPPGQRIKLHCQQGGKPSSLPATAGVSLS